MRRARGKNLDDNSIADIVSMLDGWTGRLSWELLIDAIDKRTKVRYTRQALYAHERIRLGFGVRKKALPFQAGEHPPFDGPPELRLALDEVARLKGENQRLLTENDRLLEQFARWVYNAHQRGLTAQILNQPLPSVDRERSDQPPKGRAARNVKGG